MNTVTVSKKVMYFWKMYKEGLGVTVASRFLIFISLIEWFIQCLTTFDLACNEHCVWIVVRLAIVKGILESFNCSKNLWVHWFGHSRFKQCDLSEKVKRFIMKNTYALRNYDKYYKKKCSISFVMTINYLLHSFVKLS